MGAVKMKTFFITGAAGFLGNRIVQQALNRGHEIKAIIRPGRDVSHLSWKDNAMVEFIEVDLADETAVDVIRSLISGFNQDNSVFVHAAGLFTGNDKAHSVQTIEPTRRIFKTLMENDVRRVILISSLSVYGYSSLPEYSQLDELTPKDFFLHFRDSYCRAKIAQEGIAISAAQNNNFVVSILRPGVIYGQDRLWNSRLGIIKGSIGVTIGKSALLPLISVDDCAYSIVLTGERDYFISDVYIEKNISSKPSGALEIINVVGDEQVTQDEYLKIIQKHCDFSQKVFIAIPWLLMKQVSKLVLLLGMFWPKLIAKLPFVLLEPSLHARFKPLKYSNCRLKDRLDWSSKSSLKSNVMKI